MCVVARNWVCARFGGMVGRQKMNATVTHVLTAHSPVRSFLLGAKFSKSFPGATGRSNGREVVRSVMNLDMTHSMCRASYGHAMLKSV